jgi:hypothetical protein
VAVPAPFLPPAVLNHPVDGVPVELPAHRPLKSTMPRPSPGPMLQALLLRLASLTPIVAERHPLASASPTLPKWKSRLLRTGPLPVSA